MNAKLFNIQYLINRFPSTARDFSTRRLKHFLSFFEFLFFYVLNFFFFVSCHRKVLYKERPCKKIYKIVYLVIFVIFKIVGKIKNLNLFFYFFFRFLNLNYFWNF